MTKSREAAHPKLCIFCSTAGKMTREHIWGKWLKQFVRRDMNKHHFHAQRIPRPGAPTTSLTHLKAGDPLSSQVRVVCTKCNNTWLSRIQEEAKPILIPLIRGQRSALGENAQKKLSAWCAMATMTAEYIDPDPYSVAIPQKDRDWLMNTGAAPPGWRIWIGDYLRHKWVPRWTHFTFPMLDAKDMPTSADAPPQLPNTQVTTFTAGRLYVHVMSSVHADTMAKWHWGFGPAPSQGRLLAQILPHKESFIAWPPISLTDQSADTIAAAFKLYTDAISRGMIGGRLY